MKTQKILFIHYGEQWLRGSEICLFNLMTNLSKPYQAILWTNNKPLYELAKTHQIQGYLSDFHLLFGWKKPKFNLLATGRLIERTCSLIKEHNINLIHANSAAPNQWAVVAAFFTKTPLVTQLHCHYNLRDRASLLLHLCPHIITVSKAITTELLKDGFSTSQLSIIYNGVSELSTKKENKAFSVRQLLSIQSNAPVLISIGSLIERKGFERIIAAVKSLHQQGIKAHLVIIGEGTWRKVLETLITKLNLQPFIHLVGEQNDITHWLNSGCDIFVSGAKSEAFGLVLVEAALAKIPIIAPNVGGIPEVIEHDFSGLLYDSKNADTTLPQAITTLLNNKKLAQALAANAYIQVKRRFSLSKNTQSIESVYQDLLTKPSIIQDAFCKKYIYIIRGFYRPIQRFFIEKMRHISKKEAKE